MNNKLSYHCLKCNYICEKINDWNRHCLTRKHNNLNNKITYIIKNKIHENEKHKNEKHKNEKHENENHENENHENENIKYICVCGREYKYRQGLFKHQQKCLDNETTNHEITSETVLRLVKENKDLKHILQKHQNQTDTLLQQNSALIEVAKNAHTNIHNSSNCNNKTFNLNIFLNETCKDALNINDFVDSIKLQLNDLENVGKLGFVNGISHIIVKNLQALNETQRPVHCTDRKRKTIYVKDENKWEKENEEYKKVRKAIKRVANKNSKLLFEFKEIHPDCIDSESKHSEKYSKLIVEAYGGQGQEDTDNENKIIHNILKVVTIDK